jgi:hypothetical protein
VGDFIGGATNTNLPMEIKKISDFGNKISNGVKRFEFEGGVIKLTRTVMTKI